MGNASVPKDLQSIQSVSSFQDVSLHLPQANVWLVIEAIFLSLIKIFNPATALKGTNK